MKYEDKTLDELLQLRKAIEADPASRNPPGSFWTFTREATDELLNISEHIARKRKEAKQHETRREDD